MAPVNKPLGTAEFILSEANHARSRDEVSVTAGANVWESGTVMGQITASGAWVRHVPGATNGSQVAKGILFQSATGTVDRTMITRDAEVVGAMLTYSAGASGAAIAAANAELAAAGIIVR
ncbi:MAG: head decoration protein [Roseovarius sp.]|nr:head decoration protein [Roseovarius sp.]